MLGIVVVLLVASVIALGTGSADNQALWAEGGNKPPGSPSASKVTIIEYSDFQCPYCAKAVPTLNQIREVYGNSVEIVYKHFPLSFHQYAEKAAEASEAARAQGKFWEYQELLFENQDDLSISNLKQLAAKIGLNTQQFNSDLDSGKYATKVQNDLQEGLAKGVSGTPTFFINGQKLVGAQPFSEFKKIIDSELGLCDSTCTEQQNCGLPGCEAITGGDCGC